jgi:lysozyme
MKVTAKMAAELAADEAIVLEAYKDSVGVWTWGIGVTSASGHEVERYIDNPQPLERVLDVFVWLLEEKYAPAVRNAFRGCNLTEQQFGAALSFHYNTGAIGRASWVKKFIAGDVDGARRSFMNWKKPSEIVPRRKRERDLFFGGDWHSNGEAAIYGVRKPSYAPNWRDRRVVDCIAPLNSLLSPDNLLPPASTKARPAFSLASFIKSIFGVRT